MKNHSSPEVDHPYDRHVLAPVVEPYSLGQQAPFEAVCHIREYPEDIDSSPGDSQERLKRLVDYKYNWAQDNLLPRLDNFPRGDSLDHLALYKLGTQSRRGMMKRDNQVQTLEDMHYLVRSWVPPEQSSTGQP